VAAVGLGCSFAVEVPTLERSLQHHGAETRSLGSGGGSTMKHRAPFGLLIALVLVPAWAAAQAEVAAPPEPPPEAQPTPARSPAYVQGGFVGLGGIPLAPFGNVVGAGWGLAMYATDHPRRQPLGLRFEFSFLEYGSEKIGVTVGDTGGRVKLDDVGLHVRTSNDLIRFALGPQIAARRGRLRPFVYATGGLSWFSTISKLNYDGAPSEAAIATTTNCSDWTLSWSTGAGMLVHLRGGGFLELGVRYLANLPVDWLAEGDLGHDRIGARPQPRHSEVNLIEIVVGIGIAAAP
jgi:hypothetical protein